ncbi:hypothetical protein RSOL_558170, partial [Rhizoctonia solani AG-3 Rhs1AP]
MAVATKSNVLAVLNPGSTGNIVWHRQFDQSEGRILQYKTHRDALASISGPGGSYVRLFESFSGNLLWERQLHPPSSGRLLEPANLGVDVVFWHELSDIDAYVLTKGITVSRLEGKSSKTVWSWNTDDISYHPRITHGMRDVFVFKTRDTNRPASSGSRSTPILSLHRKTLVVATSYGTLLGIDTTRGTVVWSKINGVSSIGPVDVTLIKLFITKSALEGPDPEVVVVAGISRKEN